MPAWPTATSRTATASQVPWWRRHFPANRRHREWTGGTRPSWETSCPPVETNVPNWPLNRPFLHPPHPLSHPWITSRLIPALRLQLQQRTATWTRCTRLLTHLLRSQQARIPRWPRILVTLATIIRLCTQLLRWTIGEIYRAFTYQVEKFVAQRINDIRLQIQVPHRSDGKPIPIQASGLLLSRVPYQHSVQRFHRRLATYLRDASTNK